MHATSRLSSSRWKRSLFCLCLWLASVPAGSETRAIDLYGAVVEVESRAAGARRAAAGDALAIVYNRITGSSRAAQDYPQLSASLGRAERLVTGYQYRQQDDELLLDFSFDQAAVRRELAAAGAPFWSGNRPVVEVWLVEQRGTRRDFVTRDKSPGLYAALQRAAQRYGLPVVIPAEQGDGRLNLRRAWQQADSELVQAAARGNTSNAIFGRVTSSANGWLGQWKIYNSGELRTRRVNASSADAVAGAALQPLASALAQRFAVRGNTAGSAQLMHLTVANIADQRDYLAMISTLESIEGINNLQLLEVIQGECRFSFSFNGSTAQARALLALNRRLSHTGLGDELRFGWRR